MGLTDVGRSAAGEQIKVEAITQDQAGLDQDGDDSEEMVEHRYRLRAGLELCIPLPADLTTAEAGRVASAFHKPGRSRSTGGGIACRVR